MGKSFEFLQFVQVRVESLSASKYQFGGQVDLVCLELLQVRIEFMSAALCQFGGQVFWIPAGFAIQGRIVVSCQRRLGGQVPFFLQGLSRCQLPYASSVDKSSEILQLSQCKVESLSPVWRQVSWISADFEIQD